MESSKLPKQFLLGTWVIEPISGTITKAGGETQHLEPKVMEVLVCLASRAGEVVTREQLLHVAWDGCVTADEQLTRVISELRRALHDCPGSPNFIETVPKRGYRLIQQVCAVAYNNVDSAANTSLGFGGRNMRLLGIAVLLLAIIYVAFDRYELSRAPVSTIVGEKSIAVLPFSNLSEDAGAEYFADGFSEDVISLLGASADLKVIGRTSSFAFKGKNEDLRVIGQQLGVTSLLEGSVRKSGDTVRIVAQLIDASDGAHIWANSYDLNLNEIFEVQNDIASSVAEALGIQVTSVSDRDPPTTNSGAYSAFLKGRVAVNRLEWSDAAEWLEKAIQLDPQYAKAYELLAYCYWYAAFNGFDADRARGKAYEAASSAIAINPDLIFAQRLYRSIPGQGPSDDLEASEWAYSQRPGNPMVLDSLVYMYSVAGYPEEALRVAREYAEIEPLSLDANLDLFGALYSAGHVEEAMQVLEIVDQIGLGPSNWQWHIAGVMLNEGDDELAIAYFESLLHNFDDMDSTWVRELVSAARDPDTGQAYLDQRIPEIAESLSKEGSFDWQTGFVAWYLYFGFVDRFFEHILPVSTEIGAWTDLEEHLWSGHAFRQVGFTASPEYIRLATDHGIVEIWKKRGPPDFCRESGETWVCE